MKIGFIGAGFVANFHRRGLQSVRGAELVGVYAPQGAKELVAQSTHIDGLGNAIVHPSIASLCAAVDVVAIFAPNFARLEVMREIALAKEAGAPIRAVVCEKPLARNMAEAREMVELASSADLLTAYFENQIHMPGVQAARQQLVAIEKAMGPVALTRSAEEHGGPHEPWFWDPTMQGGGVWCDMGCHSVAVGQYMLTPQGRTPNFLDPVRVNATMCLLKWGREPWLSQLRARGVDYAKTPAEDYATAAITFRNPQTGQEVLAQATDSWCYDAPGLRLLMEAIGPGYSYTINSLVSPSGVFISDAAAAAVADAELALEKAQASRGSLILHANEPDLYGYVAEWRDALANFEQGRNGLLDFGYGADIVRLVMAGYLSAERRMSIDLTDGVTNRELESYIPLIQQGKGLSVLC